MPPHEFADNLTDSTLPRQTGFRVFSHFGAQDLDILPAFYRHYLGLGVSSFHFVVHGNKGLAAKVKASGQGANVTVAKVYEGPFDEATKCHELTTAIRPFAGEWVLIADSDEFLELPYRDLPTTVRALNAFGLTSLPGQLVDRISPDGSLPEIRADNDPQVMFPNFTRVLYREMAIERPPWLAKFPLFFVFGTTIVKKGHHLPPNGISPLHAPIRAAVHHFKWRAALGRSFELREIEGGNTAMTAVYRRWLEGHDHRLPTDGAVPYSRRALFDESLLRRPNRREISNLVLHARRARLAEAGATAPANPRLDKSVQEIQTRWDLTSAGDPRHLRARSSGLLAPRGHIAFVTFELAGPTRTGGIGTAVAAAAERLAADGHKISVLFCLIDRAQPDQLWLDFWSARGVNIDTLADPANAPFDRRRPRAEIGHEVLNWLRRIEPDIVHFHDCLGFGAIAAAAKRQGLALQNTIIVVDTHGSTGWHKRGNLQRLSVEELYTGHAEIEQFRYADAVASPSAYMLNWLAEHDTPLPERRHVLRNLQGSAARAAAAPLRSDWRPRDIAFFGRIEFRKGIDVFCDAISILAASGRTDFTVTLLGRINPADGAEEYVRKAAESWPVPWHLITSYGTPDALSYLRGARAVAVIPSRVDNAPYTIYECLENGIPFFTSSRGGIPELIAEPDHERVLRANSAEELAAAFADALNAGHAPADPAFEPDEADLQWLAWHGELLKEVRAGRPDVAVESTMPRLKTVLYGDAPARIMRRTSAAARNQNGAGTDLPFADHSANDKDFDDTRAGVETLSELSGGAFMNRAVADSDASLFLFCDASVELDSEAARTFCRAIEGCEADAVVCSNRFQMITEGGSLRTELDKIVIHAPAGPSTLCPIKNVFGAPAFLISKAAFERVGGASEDPQMRGVEHWDLLNRLVQQGGTIASVPVPLATQFISSLDHPLLRPPERVTDRLLAPYVAATPGELKDAVRLLPILVEKDGYVPDTRMRIEGLLVRSGIRKAPESDREIRGLSPEHLRDRLHHMSRMYDGLSLSRVALLRQFLALTRDRLMGRPSRPPWRLQSIRDNSTTTPPIVSNVVKSKTQGAATLYQELDQGHFDYRLVRLNSDTGPWIRGPAIDRKRDFIACVGSARTFGRFANHPYPEILARRLEVQALNFGICGAGPKFFDRPHFLEWLGGARVVVFQVLSGRSASNSLFEYSGGASLFGKRRRDGQSMKFERFLAELMEREDREVVQRVIAETRQDYLDGMIGLLERIKRPKVLLWIGDRDPDAEDDYRSADALLGGFPHLVDRSMLEEMRARCDAFVECRSTNGLPQTLWKAKSSIEGADLDSGTLVNRHYPSPQIHGEVGDLLAEDCRRLSKRRSVRPVADIKSADAAGVQGVKRYVILSTSRSGTTLLNGLLGSHPDVVAGGELFNDPVIENGIIPWPDPTVRRDPELNRLWRREPVALLEHLVNSVEWPSCQAVGFRLMYGQCETHPEIVDHLFANPSYRIIHLKRRNLLRRYLSNNRAMKTNVWWVGADDTKSYEAPSEKIDLLKCVQDFRRVEDYRVRFDDLFRNHEMLDVYYEDVAADPQAEGARVIEFLGLEPADELRITSRKTGTDKLREAIPNYDELKSNLNRWLSFFEE